MSKEASQEARIISVEFAAPLAVLDSVSRVCLAGPNGEPSIGGGKVVTGLRYHPGRYGVAFERGERTYVVPFAACVAIVESK